MRKFYLFYSLCLTALIVLSAIKDIHAFHPRLNGMALDESTYWMMQEDEQLVFMNPAQLSNFSPFLWIGWYNRTSPSSSNEYRYQDGEGGLNLKPIESLSIYITTHGDVTTNLNSSSNTYDMYNIIAGGAYTPASSIADTDVLNVVRASNEIIYTEQINATLCYSMNSLAFGATIGYTAVQDQDKDSTMNTENDYKRSQMRLKLGSALELNRKMDIDAALEFRSFGIDNKSSSTAMNSALYQDDGAYNLNALSRLNFATGNTSRWHAYIKLELMDYSTTLQHVAIGVNESDTFERTGNAIHLGASQEIDIDNDVLLFYGILVSRTVWRFNFEGNSNGFPNTAYSADRTLMAIPFNIGLEAKLNKYFTARLGATHRLYDSDITESSTVESQNLNDDTTKTRAAIGLSFRAKNFLFEWELKKGLFINGPYFINGPAYNGENNLATSLVISYFFGTPGKSQDDDKDTKATPPEDTTKEETSEKLTPKIEIPSIDMP